MTQPFMRTPFATAGDTTTIPNSTQPDGSVSYTDGFTVNYQLATDDPDVLYPERPVINELFKVIMQAIQVMQIHGFPDWITSSANGGSPYSYDINSIVRHTNVNWISLQNSNTAEPGTDVTKWIPFTFPDAFQTGDMLMWESNTIRSGGWLWCNGQTIGNASSGGTARANADTENLFTLIWNQFPNAVRPIQDSSGAPSTRGASAAADFAANKRIPLRDMRDVVPAGLGTMGGASDRALLTSSNTLGVDGTVFGATGGEQLHTQTTAELAEHAHGGTTGGTGLTAAQGPQHRHLEFKSNSVAVTSELHPNYPPYARGNIAGSQNPERYWMASSSSGTPLEPDVGLSGLPISSANGSPHTHPISSSGSSTPFNVVQPTTICNFIIKL